MTTLESAPSASAGRVQDLSDSLDVRLAVAGRLSRSALDIHHDRAELATVLASGGPRAGTSAKAPHPDCGPEEHVAV